MSYLPPGCATPRASELEAFWQKALDASSPASSEYSVRWIGLDHDSTEQVIELILAGDKTGTFTLPWIVEQTDHPVPAVDDAIILIDFAGYPRLLFEITKIETVNFGDISARHIQVDGSPVRDLSVWKPLHISYWNGMLNPFGLAVSDDMPVWIEKFRLLYFAN
jgi:uncharacterized protein YhfF